MVWLAGFSLRPFWLHSSGCFCWFSLFCSSSSSTLWTQPFSVPPLSFKVRGLLDCALLAQHNNIVWLFVYRSHWTNMHSLNVGMIMVKPLLSAGKLHSKSTLMHPYGLNSVSEVCHTVQSCHYSLYLSIQVWTTRHGSCFCRWLQWKPALLVCWRWPPLPSCWGGFAWCSWPTYLDFISISVSMKDGFFAAV